MRSQVGCGVWFRCFPHQLIMTVRGQNNNMRMRRRGWHDQLYVERSATDRRSSPSCCLCCCCCRSGYCLKIFQNVERFAIKQCHSYRRTGDRPARSGLKLKRAGRRRKCWNSAKTKGSYKEHNHYGTSHPIDSSSTQICKPYSQQFLQQSTNVHYYSSIYHFLSSKVMFTYSRSCMF